MQRDVGWTGERELPGPPDTRPSIPLPPYGTLGIDPRLVVALPPFIIPQPAGVGSIGIPVPNVPSFVGLPVYLQALLVPYPFEARLSNVVADEIGP